MTDRGKKAYIPWHERVDEALIKHIASQFVKDAFAEGFRVRSLEVIWKANGNFDVSATGEPLTRIKPTDGEPLH